MPLMGQIQKAGYVDLLGQRLSDSIERIKYFRIQAKLTIIRGRSSGEMSSNS